MKLLTKLGKILDVVLISIGAIIIVLTLPFIINYIITSMFY